MVILRQFLVSFFLVTLQAIEDFLFVFAFLIICLCLFPLLHRSYVRAHEVPHTLYCVSQVSEQSTWHRVVTQWTIFVNELLKISFLHYILYTKHCKKRSIIGLNPLPEWWKRWRSWGSFWKPMSLHQGAQHRFEVSRRGGYLFRSA